MTTVQDMANKPNCEDDAPFKYPEPGWNKSKSRDRPLNYNRVRKLWTSGNFIESENELHNNLVDFYADNFNSEEPALSLSAVSNAGKSHFSLSRQHISMRDELATPLESDRSA